MSAEKSNDLKTWMKFVTVNYFLVNIKTCEKRLNSINVLKLIITSSICVENGQADCTYTKQFLILPIRMKLFLSYCFINKHGKINNHTFKERYFA